MVSCINLSRAFGYAKRIGMLLLAVIALFGTLSAQTAGGSAPEKPIEVYLTTGGAFPTSDFNIRYDFGYNGSVGLGFRLRPDVRLITRLEVQSFAIGQITTTDTVSGGGLTALLSGVDLRYFHDIAHWPLDPMIVVGGGLAYFSVSDLTIGAADYPAYTETKFFYNVGVGVNTRITPRLSAFVMFRYVHVTAGLTKAEFFPLNVGIRF